MIEALESYLHAQIPLSAAMDIRVLAANTQGVRLSAPLAPNVNHHQTAFGGSISTLATLACWTYVYVLLKGVSFDGNLVIHQNEIEYVKPILGDFEALTLPVETDEIGRFLETLRKRGKSRLTVRADVVSAGEVCARFSGRFVATLQSGQD